MRCGGKLRQNDQSRYSTVTVRNPALCPVPPEHMHRCHQINLSSLLKYPIPFLLCASDGGGTWHRSVELAPTRSRRAKAASDGEMALRWAPLGAPSSGCCLCPSTSSIVQSRRRRGSSTEYSDHATASSSQGEGCEMQALLAPLPRQKKTKRIVVMKSDKKTLYSIGINPVILRTPCLNAAGHRTRARHGWATYTASVSPKGSKTRPQAAKNLSIKDSGDLEVLHGIA